MAQKLGEESLQSARMMGGPLGIATSPFGIPALDIIGRQESLLHKAVQGAFNPEGIKGFKPSMKQNMAGLFYGGNEAGRKATRVGMASGTAKRLVGGFGELLAPLSVGFMAYDIATVHKLPEEKRLGFLASSATGYLGGILGYAGGFLIGGLATVPGVGWAAAIGLTVGFAVFGQTVGEAVNLISEVGYKSRRLELGGDFRDTQDLATMRMRSMQEMSGSLMNARQYLGNEAAFFHG